MDKQYFLNWIDNHKTERGGYSRKLVESLGISYPLKKGWKQRFAERCIEKPYLFLADEMHKNLQQQYK